MQLRSNHAFPVSSKFVHLHPTFGTLSSCKRLCYSKKVSSFNATSQARTVLLGIDPDTKGAIAVLEWPMHEENLAAPLCSMTAWLYDMPTVKTQLKAKQKGKFRERTWLDVHTASRIVSNILDGARAKGPVEFKAVIEASPIQPMQSHLSKTVVSYSVGMWHGILTASGVESNTAPVKAWKAGLALSADKDDSRALAAQMFPHMAHLFKLKRHHGRAEALLIAAWAAGYTAVRTDLHEISEDLQLGATSLPIWELQQNVPKPSISTDGYGNPIIYSNDTINQVLSLAVARSSTSSKKSTPKRKTLACIPQPHLASGEEEQKAAIKLSRVK